MAPSPAVAALAQATAGAAGGIFATFSLQPIEVAKTRIQVGNTEGGSTLEVVWAILRKEGFLGLYKGLGAKSAETASKNFVYFYFYDWIFRLTKKPGGMSTLMNLLVGFIAGVGTTSSTMPLEVIATQLQADSREGVTLQMVLRNILQKDGIAGLWKGFGLNIMLCTNPAIQNTVFDKIKAWILHAKSGGDLSVFVSLTATEAFLLGAFAKAVATVITYPLTRVKTILQAGQSAKAANGGKGCNGCDVTNGNEPRESALAKFASLYRGLSSSLLKTVLQAALLYMMKDQIAGLVVKLFRASSGMLRQAPRRHKLKGLSGRPLAT